MSDSKEYIGFIRYKGAPLAQGYLDARQSAKALTGFDSALRYFVAQQDEQLARTDYPIPVRIRSGSWEALVPHNIGEWILGAGGVAITTYLATAAQKTAENDFKDVSIRILFKKAIQGMQWLLKIGKHCGTLAKHELSNLVFRNNNQEIGIPNENGEYLYVPAWLLELVEKAPPNLLRDIASLVSSDIRLYVVVRDGQQDSAETLDFSERAIFCSDETEVRFPELVDGMEVTLEGLVTRGNENSNTIGFEYQGYILTCYPKEGDVVKYKPALFLKSRISGVVEREEKAVNGRLLKKPRIIFTNLEPLEDAHDEGLTPGLFDDPDPEST